MKTEDTDETYLDALMAREGCDMDKTPGFRDWVLDLMATIGERPRSGDLHSMHLAYQAGMETARAEHAAALQRLAACEPVIEAVRDLQGSRVLRPGIPDIHRSFEQDHLLTLLNMPLPAKESRSC